MLAPTFVGTRKWRRGEGAAARIDDDGDPEALIDTMAAQPPVAQDISAEIEDADLEYAKQLVDSRADGKPVGQISEYGAYSFPVGQSLYISFDWHENTPARKARYNAEFDRETADEQWKLSEIGFTGEQVRAGQDQPIHFNGYLDRETLEQVTAYVAGMWTRWTKHRYAIRGILTNRLPPIYRGTDSSESGGADIVYQVSIRDLSPRHLPVQQPQSNALTIGSIGSSDNTYTVRMTDVGSGRFRTTQADCASGANCDPELLARLRADLDQPMDSKEIEKRLRDAVAVLPTRLRGAQIRNTQTLMLGTTEQFIVLFGETPVSGSRKETASVTCFRPTGTRDDWSCSCSVDSVSQRVPGQTREVHLSGSTFNEAEVEQIVEELRRLLTGHPNLGAASGEIEFFNIHPNDDNFECFFICGRGFWKAVFTYDDEVRLEGLELFQKLPEGVGTDGKRSKTET